MESIYYESSDLIEGSFSVLSRNSYVLTFRLIREGLHNLLSYGIFCSLVVFLGVYCLCPEIVNMGFSARLIFKVGFQLNYILSQNFLIHGIWLFS